MFDGLADHPLIYVPTGRTPVNLNHLVLSVNLSMALRHVIATLVADFPRMTIFPRLNKAAPDALFPREYSFLSSPFAVNATAVICVELCLVFKNMLAAGPDLFDHRIKISLGFLVLSAQLFHKVKLHPDLCRVGKRPISVYD